jgi:hypothetical protein
VTRNILTCIIINLLSVPSDRLCGLVVRFPGHRPRDPGFDSRRYQIFWEVVGLEQGPLSIVSITEELRECKNSAPGLENRDNGRGDPLRWPRDTLYTQELALTSPTGGGCSVGVVRLWTKSTQFSQCLHISWNVRRKTYDTSCYSVL